MLYLLLRNVVLVYMALYCDVMENCYDNSQLCIYRCYYASQMHANFVCTYVNLTEVLSVTRDNIHSCPNARLPQSYFLCGHDVMCQATDFFDVNMKSRSYRYSTRVLMRDDAISSTGIRTIITNSPVCICYCIIICADVELLLSVNNIHVSLALICISP